MAYLYIDEPGTTLSYGDHCFVTTSKDASLKRTIPAEQYTSIRIR